MGKKKLAQSMQEGGGSSFLAPKKEPIPAPSEVSGIQEQKAKTEQKQEPKKEQKPKLLSEMSLEELEQELGHAKKMYKEFSVIAKELEKHRDFVLKTIKVRTYLMPYLEERADERLKEVISAYREIYEHYIAVISVVYSKKQFGIEI
jgi:hypothetical protein